tara:strand:- start:2563 stop:3105 length:543 start_codon:yes stop_codon:yes gene_type:complete
MNNAQILTTTGEIKATKIWGKYQAIGRSYGRYDLPDIVAGTAAADRTITLPAKNVVVPATEALDPVGDKPDVIRNQGLNPWTWVIYIDKLEENLIINCVELQNYFKTRRYFEAYADVWLICSTPTAGKGIYWENGENNSITFTVGTDPNIRIVAYMAKREWIQPDGDDGILCPTYRRPKL